MSELLWHVDENDNPIGPIERKKAHSDASFIHRVVLILLRDAENNYLLQKRSESKDKYPGAWTVAASGHVDYLESYELAAERELREELGLIGIALTQVNTLLIRTEEESQYVGVFVGEVNKTDEIAVDRGEITDLITVDEKRLLCLLSEEQFTPFAYQVLSLLA